MDAHRTEMVGDGVAGRGRVGGVGPDFRAILDERLEIRDRLDVEVADDEEPLAREGGEGLGGLARGRRECAEPGEDLAQFVLPLRRSRSF
jgi:hypothetical protein